MPPVSTDTQNTILTRQREGATITQIAQELGLSRTTVYKSLNTVDNWDKWIQDKSNNIRRLAYNAVEKGLTRGDARLGLDYLKLTDLAPDTGYDRWQVAGDVHQHLTLLPAASSTPSTASPAESTVSTGTEAAAKPPQSDMSLSIHTNFSQFSTAELEQELARRRSGAVIDAEIVR